MDKILNNLVSLWSLIRGFPAIAGPWAFIKAIPEIYRAVKLVLKIAGDVNDYFERRKHLENFRNAVEKARLTKDTSDLEKLFAGVEIEKVEDNKIHLGDTNDTTSDGIKPVSETREQA